MNIKIEPASIEDAEDFIEVSNRAFHSDYIKYGYCPGYNMPLNKMQEIILTRFNFKIIADKKIIGRISAKKIDDKNYFLSCLCIIPEYENKGIGQKAVKFIENYFPNDVHWSLETPADKMRNHYFYKKLGFKITKEYMDGPVKIVLFEKQL